MKKKGDLVEEALLDVEDLVLVTEGAGVSILQGKGKEKVMVV
jgi:hypothetical protein